MFRIDLPIYRGPIDLLLYLIRRHELDASEVSLTAVVDQYLQFLETLAELDLGEAADFLDMAATLVELKSHAVLPRDEEEAAEKPIVDPIGEDLVARLLEYKQIRDAAAVLDEMGERWQTRYERLSDDLPPRKADPADQPVVGLEVWDLVSAFGRIIRESAGPPPTQIIDDDTPIHVYMQKIHARLADQSRVALTDLVTVGLHKSAYIGWFLATLELTRHHGAEVRQDEHGEIHVARTEAYREELKVAEVDNAASDALADSALPIRMR